MKIGFIEIELDENGWHLKIPFSEYNTIWKKETLLKLDNCEKGLSEGRFKNFKKDVFSNPIFKQDLVKEDFEKIVENISNTTWNFSCQDIRFEFDSFNASRGLISLKIKFDFLFYFENKNEAVWFKLNDWDKK